MRKLCWCGKEVRHNGPYYKHLCISCRDKYVYKLDTPLPGILDPVEAEVNVTLWLRGFYVYISRLGGLDPNTIPTGYQY